MKEYKEIDWKMQAIFCWANWQFTRRSRRIKSWSFLRMSAKRIPSLSQTDSIAASDGICLILGDKLATCLTEILLASHCIFYYFHPEIF